MNKIKILENTVRKRQEKVDALEKIMEPYQKRIEYLENYALENHHKWTREKRDKESQKLTDVCIKLADWESEYNDAKLWLDRAKIRLKKAREISEE